MKKKDYPKKLFYKIGEVADITELEPYVLRYWEGEFNLKLTKSKNHQRLYQQKDIDQICRIKDLLYDEKFTIAGAKKRLREKKKGSDAEKDQLPLGVKTMDRTESHRRQFLQEVKQELENILDIVSPTPPSANA